MMKSSNRSPSPMSSRPNPNSRNGHENMDSSRRSFNKPSEYMGRSSFGARDYEQKENEQEHNPYYPQRIRSPSVGKGSKNFMSPTISAASKINASPRKKVLGERNEAVRTSASLSSGKFTFYSTESLQTDMMETTTEGENCDSRRIIENIMTAEFQNEFTEPEPEPDMVVLSPDMGSCFTETSPMPTMIASLDVGPKSAAPYDPKNNYLSPRPQFLHYKPKPRVEVYINHGIRLEDEFVPESSSEPESSSVEEICQSQDSVEECDEKSESSPISEPSDLRLAVESEVVAKCKSGFFFTWSKAFVLVLLLSTLALPLVTYYSPSITITDTWNQDEMVSKVLDESHKVADLAREHFESLLHSFKSKSVQSFNQLSLMIDGFRQVEKFGHSTFENVTVLQGSGDYVFEQCTMDSFGKKGGNEVELVYEMGIIENEGEYRNFESKEQDGYFEESRVMQPDYMEVQELEQQSLIEINQEASEQTQENADKLFGVLDEPPSFIETVFENSEAMVTDQQFLIENNDEDSEQVQGNIDEPQSYIETVSENSELLATDQQSVIENRDEKPQSEQSQENLDVTPAVPSKPETVIAKLLEAVNSLKQLLTENMVATGVSTATLLVAAILLCLKLSNNKQQVMKKSAVASDIKPQSSLKPCSQSDPVESSEMVGESCSSEISHFKRGSRTADEVQSHERNNVKRNQKRESLASTSSSDFTMGSPSYGSFTTYSIVHAKQGDEEVVTPIRRSSRIRKQVAH